MTRTAIAGIVITLMTMTTIGVASHQDQVPKCSLNEADAPPLRGVRLGMSAEQVAAMFPATASSKELKDEWEKAKSPDSDPIYLGIQSGDGDKERLKGVAGLSIGLYRNRVVEINIQYIGPDWENIDEWIAKLSETLKLPGAKAWRTGPNEDPNKVLTCNGIEIEATIQGGGASIKITNVAALRPASDRKKAAEEKQKREYRP